MRALFTTALIIIALSASAFAYFAATPVRKASGPSVKVDISTPPADFDKMQEDAVLKLRPPPQPIAAPAPAAAAAPIEAAAPVPAMEPGEVIPGLAVEGFNDPSAGDEPAAKASGDGAAPPDVATTAADKPKVEEKAKAKPEKSAAKTSKTLKPKKIDPAAADTQLATDVLPGATDQQIPDGSSTDASEP